MEQKAAYLFGSDLSFAAVVIRRIINTKASVYITYCCHPICFTHS